MEQEGIVWLLLKGLCGLVEFGTRGLRTTWKSSDSCSVRGTAPCSAWAIGDWVEDETGVGSRQQLERVARNLGRKYGISHEGEMRWTLGIGVNPDYL